MIDFDESDLRRFAPKMAEFYRRALLEGKAHLAEAGILANGKRLSHFLGQCAAETGGFTILRESLTYSSTARIAQVWPARAKKETAANLKKLVRNPVALGDWAYGGRMGNRKGTIDAPHHDGYDYRGGGLLQCTGRSAVQKYCDLCKIDIRPDILDDPEATLQFACAEWKESGCNALADANDLMGISKTINVGSAAANVIPNGMENREAWFKKAQKIWWDAEPEVFTDTSKNPATVAEAASVPLSVKATVAPPSFLSIILEVVRRSRTFLGLLIAAFGTLFSWCKDVVLEAASQITLLAPARDVAVGLGIKAATIAFGVTIAGIAIALLARFDAAHKGKIG